MCFIPIVRAAIAPAVVLLAPALCPAQITLGQVDSFTDGTTMNWSEGLNSPNPPGVVLGGPGGPTDNYLQDTASGGLGAGSRLTIFNRNQWKGNYNAAGVAVIEMDLRAPTTNTQTLQIRIAFKVDPGQFSPGYVSTTPFPLPADGQWHHASFALDAGQMTEVGNAPDFPDLLNGPGELRILHSTGLVLNGDPIVATVGIDNIRASPVPEPARLLIMAAAAGAGWRLRRRAGASR